MRTNEKCFTNTGITESITAVAILTTQNADLKITCYGKYTDKFNPGFNNN
jgi:hypothetical protein